MIINELRFYNLGLYRGEHVITFSTDKDQPITLIGGMNGAGKTTILEAIILLLYGPRTQIWHKNSSYNEYLLSCMNNRISTQEQTWIQMSLSIRNNTNEIHLVVQRSWHVDNGKLTEQMRVFKDGIEDSYLASNWDLYAEEIVPIGVSGLFFFDGEKIGKLAEEDEGNKTLKIAICSLLGIDLLDRLTANLKRVISNHDWKIPQQDKEDDLIIFSNQINDLNAKVYQLDQDIAGLDAKMEYNNTKLKEKEDVYIQQGGHFFKSRSKLIEERNELNVLQSSIKTSMVNIAAGPLPLLIIEPLLKKVKDSIIQEEYINQAKLVLPYLTEHDKKVLESLTSLGISEEQISFIRTKMESEKIELTKLSQKENIFPQRYIVQQLNSLNNQANSLRKEASYLIEKYERVQNDLDQIEIQLHFDVDESNVSGILKQIKDLTKHISELEGNKKNLVDKKLEISKQKVAIEQKCNSLLKKRLEKQLESEEAQRIIKYANISIGVLYSFKEKLLIDKIDTLQQNIIEAFKQLIEKRSLISAIKIDKNTLRMSLINSDGNEFPKSQLSEGEKQMLALAFLWGLARTSGYSLPVIIDTPMARLDSTHRINFVENYLPSAGEQVVVLSTDEEIKGLHLKTIEKYIGKKYLLEFNDNLGITNIREGYFSTEDKEYDSKAS